MTARESRLRLALEEVIELAYTLPSGVDENPDPHDTCPEDVMFWTAGLIVKMCRDERYSQGRRHGEQKA